MKVITNCMFSAIISLFLFLILLVPVVSHARVTGQCANCHTMHNSQNGSLVASGGPYSVLLKNNCIGCHSASNASISIDATTGAPIVYNINGAPNYGVGSQGLAGGNFYWVAQGDDTKGHNIFSVNPDGNLSIAPGRWTGCAGGGDDNSCHKRLDTTTNPNQFGFTYPRQGCTKCHMLSNSFAPQGFHHKDDSGPVIDSDGEGWYRFLTGHNTGEGVSGIEDDDWQATYSTADHNEYLGYSGNKSAAGGFSSLANTMTAFCCGCHGEFHEEDTTVIGASPWLRHPSDAVLPASGEYSAYTTYDPLTPIARPTLTSWTVPSSTVAPGTDMVMCLSCHKPHGSQYPDMLRWDYSGMIAGSSSPDTGCFKCHSQKNN